MKREGIHTGAALAIALVIGYGAYSYVMFMAPHRVMAKGAACLSNLKHIGNAVLLYSADWGDVMPVKERWIDLSAIYGKSTGIYGCPSFSSSWFGYSYNTFLSGASTTQFRLKGLTPMAYDSVTGLKNAFDPVSSLPRSGRHNGRNAIVLLDGHVKMVDPDDMALFVKR